MFNRIMPCVALGVLATLSGCNQNSSQTADSGATSSATTSSTSSGKKPKVVYLTNGVASFWVIAEAGAKAGGEKFNADVTVLMPADISEQKRMVEDSMTRGVDGIAISPIDPVNQTPLIDQAAKVTKVITHDSDAPKSKRLCYIGMDNYTAGRMCGKFVKEALPKGGKLAIFIGRLEQDNARRRRQGVIDELLDRSSDPTSLRRARRGD